MDDDPLLLFALILLLVLLNAFFAAAEIALVSVRKTRIKQLIEEGSHRAETVQELLDNPTSFMATVQIGVTLVGFLASAVTAVNIAHIPEGWLLKLGVPDAYAGSIAVFGVTVIIGFITLVAGEIAPKSLAIQRAEKLALWTAGTINVLSMLAFPAVKIVGWFSDLLVRPFGAHVRFSSPVVTEEELKMLVEAGEEEGVIEEEEREMIHSIFDFTDTIARQVMVPRTDMHCAPVDSTLDEILDLITQTGHTRIPVYEENVDNIIGAVHAKDLLGVLRHRTDNFDVRSVLREVYFIPETKDLDDLLAEFKRSNIQMAIVRDEYGGTAGLVTIEDLLEEIVGEIQDEYDREEPMIQMVDETHATVNARMYVDDLNEQMELAIPESDEYDTIGGFVFDLFGRQPEQNETVSYSNLDFIVEKIDGGRLERISIIKTDRPVEPEEEVNGKQKNNNNNK